MVHAVIAEDDEVVRRLVEQIVAQLGWTYESTGGGLPALVAVERIIPDVVIADLTMTGLTGFDLVRAIKANPELAHIPVILLSSVGGEREARRAGCDAYLDKPFLVDDLTRILTQLVPGELASC